ncbi:MAG: hypothetical protein MJD61_14700 [Proteobacteria bacterium]|nr:hypothetical protein [Pseudomonadota bacterium]
MRDPTPQSAWPCEAGLDQSKPLAAAPGKKEVPHRPAERELGTMWGGPVARLLPIHPVPNTPKGSRKPVTDAGP